MTTINVPIVNMDVGQQYKLPATFTPSTPNHIPTGFIDSLKDRYHTLWKKTVLTTGHIFIEFIPDTDDYNNGIRHLFFHTLFLPNRINENFEQLIQGPSGAGASRRGGKRRKSRGSRINNRKLRKNTTRKSRK